ncbi:MAG: V-type ATP synthase subunit A, partial [Lachnospiraceae bacterium]|nr:V-type ATP synthase subunit A [Candidatus Hippenecus merdae]
LDEIVKMVGMDALSAPDRIKLEAARSIREDYLHQNAFDEVDTYTSIEKQHTMMKLILAYFNGATEALSEGAKVSDLVKLPCREAIGRFKYVAEADIQAEYDKIIGALKAECAEAVSKKEEF